MCAIICVQFSFICKIFWSRCMLIRAADLNCKCRMCVGSGGGGEWHFKARCKKLSTQYCGIRQLSACGRLRPAVRLCRCHGARDPGPRPGPAAAAPGQRVHIRAEDSTIAAVNIDAVRTRAVYGGELLEREREGVPAEPAAAGPAGPPVGGSAPESKRARAHTHQRTSKKIASCSLLFHWSY